MRYKVKKQLIDGRYMYQVDRKSEVGRGDKIAAVAQPIAAAIDKVAGTNVAGCGGCKKMRERLNSGMSLAESIQVRLLEFAGRKLGHVRQAVLRRVDERLKAQGR